MSLREVEQLLDSRNDPRTRVIGFNPSGGSTQGVPIPGRRDSKDAGAGGDYSTSPRLGTSPGVRSASLSSSVGKGSLEKYNMMRAAAQAGGAASETSEGGGEQKKRLSKAERRAIQEAQKAAKGAAKAGPGAEGVPPKGAEKPPKSGAIPPPQQQQQQQQQQKEGSQKDAQQVPAGGGGGGGGGSVGSVGKPGLPLQYDDPKKVKQAVKKQPVQRTKSQKQVALFAHLPQYEREASLSMSLSFSQTEIHPEVLKLGLKFAEGIVVGGVGRTLAMLNAFKCVIRDFDPNGEPLNRSLLTRINTSINFLIPCRPLNIPMGNAIRFVKEKVVHLRETTVADGKTALHEDIDVFIAEKIKLADTVIAGHGASKIKDGDVILTYAYSNVVETTLLAARQLDKKFSVVVVDAKPHFEGRKMLRALSEKGIPCTYLQINGLSFQMKQVTKVFIGAMALLSNGNVVSRCGTAMVAMMAQAYNKPVMVCCESFKFTERVLLDSICFNELGDPDDLISTGQNCNQPLADWRDKKDLALLNLQYDLTPMAYVNMVLTEVGPMIPPTSVPVIIREYRRDFGS